MRSIECQKGTTHPLSKKTQSRGLVGGSGKIVGGWRVVFVGIKLRLLSNDNQFASCYRAICLYIVL